jgi:hypothetical protein
MQTVSYEVICKLCGLKFTHEKKDARGRFRRYCDACNKIKRRVGKYNIVTTKD